MDAFSQRKDARSSPTFRHVCLILQRLHHTNVIRVSFLRCPSRARELGAACPSRLVVASVSPVLASRVVGSKRFLNANGTGRRSGRSPNRRLIR